MISNRKHIVIGLNFFAICIAVGGGIHALFLQRESAEAPSSAEQPSEQEDGVEHVEPVASESPIADDDAEYDRSIAHVSEDEPEAFVPEFALDVDVPEIHEAIVRVLESKEGGVWRSRGRSGEIVLGLPDESKDPRCRDVYFSILHDGRQEYLQTQRMCKSVEGQWIAE